MRCHGALRQRARVALITAYATLRRKVKEGRDANISPQRLEDEVLKVTWGRHGAIGRLVLQHVARDLQTKKRKRVSWGDVRKDEDRLFRLLQKKIAEKGQSVHACVIESFRARVLDQTSRRFQLSTRPKGPLPVQKRPYQVFGYGAGFTNKVALQRYRQRKQEWSQLMKEPSMLPKVTRRQPLSGATLCAQHAKSTQEPSNMADFNKANSGQKRTKPIQAKIAPDHAHTKPTQANPSKQTTKQPSTSKETNAWRRKYNYL